MFPKYKRLRIIGSVDPRHGGPVEGIRQQTLYHANAGIEEHVVSLDPPDVPWVKDFPLKVFPLGVPTSKAPRWWSKLPWWKYGYRPDFLPWLKTHVRDYDLVVVHGLWNYTAMGARRALVGTEVPYVVFTHGMLDPWFNRNFPVKRIAKQIFWWFNEGPLVNNARYVLFTSETEKILARESFKPYRVRERVVGYGTSDPAQDLEKQTAVFRALLPSLEKPYLLFLSRIHPKKGCDLLIDAFARTFKDRDDLDLVVAGPAAPEFRKSLKARSEALGIAPRIHWPGMLQGDAKWGAFRNAEAFVLPSHQENFGIVVAEAMACAKPVLISDKVNIWQDVLNCGAGLVERDDLQGTERLLRRFTDLAPDERARMGARARAGFLEMFEIRRAAESINEACSDAITGTSPNPARHISVAVG